MTLSWSSRVVRGGSAVQTVYWRACAAPKTANSSDAPAKLMRHGRVLVFGNNKQPALPPNVQQRLSASSSPRTTLS